MNTDIRSAQPSARHSGNSGLWWTLRQAAERAFGRRVGSGSERLAKAVGQADSAAAFETLEQRQLLAVVTIPASSIDPATGLGRVDSWFDYISPYLFKAIPDAQQGQQQATTEEFDDEQDFWSQINPSIPPNGTFLNTSEFRIVYNTQADNAVILLPDMFPGGAGPGDNANDRDLDVALQDTDFFGFEFWTGTQQGQTPSKRVTTNAIVTVRTGASFNGRQDGDAIKTGLNGTRLELTLDGVVVQTYAGAALRGLLTDLGDGRTILNVQFGPGFDGFRFKAADPNNTAAWSDQFIIDDVQTTYPSGRFASFVDDRRFGVHFSFVGPAGATVQLLDLYGREIQLTRYLGIPTGSQVPNPIADRNGDGVPDLNDGIGRLIFTNVDSRTAFTIIGGEGSTLDEQMNPVAPVLPDAVIGNLDDYEAAGFGFALTNTMPPAATGVPDGTGSVLIGSPIVRDRSSANAYIGGGSQNGNTLSQITPANFNRSDQGIFVNGSMGSLIVHGMVFGSSVVQGSLGSYNSGVQLGSLTVNGDVGYFGVASDAGTWQADDVTGLDPQARFTDDTDAQLIIGRTVREIAVGGRMDMAVQVLGDINNPSRPPLSFINYAEREQVYAINPQNNPPGQVVLGATLNRTANGAGTFFGAGLFRNDNLQNAEFIGYNGTAVRLTGGLGAQDPTNSEDFTDVFAFAADPTREVVIQGNVAGLLRGGYARIVNRQGLTVAAFDQGAAGRGPGGNNGGGNVIRFRPDQADVFYLVLNLAPDNGFGVASTYDVTIAGMAPVTLGAVTTGAGVGSRLNMLTADPNAQQFLLTLNAGSMGLLRIGVGVTDGMGALIDPNTFINSNQSSDDLLDFGYSSITVPNDLFGVVAGSDIAGANLLVGRNLGVLTTGTSPVAGVSNQDGDITAADIRVGGSIGTIEIAGALGANQDPDPDGLAGEVSIRSGTRGGVGNIGQILVGAYVIGSNVSVATSPGSVIDQFIVADGAGTQFPGAQIRQNIPRFTTGIGSDIRFADFGLIQRPSDPNLRIILNYNQAYNFVDDAGAQYTVSITGGTAAGNTSFLEAFAFSPDGSQGVALARLDVRLRQGATLNITATGAQAAGESGATISIGRIRILEADPTSAVIISDAPGVQAEIDVWRIESAAPLDRIVNTTRGRGSRAGDLVAVDVAGINTVTVQGNLGLTETHGGPTLLGPFVGLAGADGGVGGAFGVSAAAIDRGFIGGNGDEWDGSIFVPVQVANYDQPNPLEDLGSPLDPYLNGLVVRGGDLQSVTAGGSLGDVVVVGDLLSAVANSDTTRPFGAFEGIVGSIYANSILRVDVGDGLRGTGSSPFAAAGIFANDEIIFVTATRIPGAVIDGVILAADFDNAPRTTIGTGENPPVIQNIRGVPREFRGIGDISINDATINGAFIQSSALDDWWKSARVADTDYTTGNVDSITLVRTDLFRSEIVGNIVGTISVTGGAFDSTTVDAIENIGLVTADSYRNSTVLGRPTEVHANMISSSRNIGSIITTNLTGDIADLVIDVIGSVTGRIAAGNLLRLSINVDNVINEITATTDVRGTSIVSGQLTTMTVGRNLKNTEMMIAGPIGTATVGNEIVGLTIISSGPDGRIGTLRANGRIQANISSSGPIQVIESITSDITGRIETTDDDGNIGTLHAGRDLLIDAVFSGSATTISADRHIGRAADLNDRALDIRGDLGTLSAGGQIYSDILVGQSITGTVTVGRVSAKPGRDQVGAGDIKAFGRINALDVQGDFNGNITSYSHGIGTISITNGTFRQGKTITALGGSIDHITITGGDLLGNIYTEGDLTLLELLTGANNYKSHIGISRFKSDANPVPGDPLRNELPPGTIRTAGANGARIYAGHDIGRIFLQGGSIYESTIIAGRTITDITLTAGSIRNDELSTQQASFIIAGDRIEKISVKGNSDNINIAVGVISLGDDNALGGVGSATDTVKQGSIGTIAFSGAKNKDIAISAGVNAGADGVYNSTNNDDTLATGVSNIDSVTVRAAKKSSVYADGSIGAISGGNGLRRISNGTGLAAADPTLQQNTRPAGSVVITPGQIFSFTSPFNQKATILFNGPGRAYYDAAGNRVVLLDTTAESSLTVQGRKSGRNNSNAQLKDFVIVGDNNAALGTLNLRVFLRGNSNIFMDGAIGALNANRIDTGGVVGAGGDITSVGLSRMDRGTLLGRDVGTLAFSGPFVGGIAQFLDLGTLRVSGTFSGAVSSDHDIDTVTLGAGNLGEVRSGGDIGAVTATSLSGTVFSARDSIGTVNVIGNVDDSAIYAGIDLGRDANFGGTGVNADIVSNGDITSVTVGGGFTKSDVSAGVYRGADGFLGTSDDVAADGRSTVGNVVIGARNLGSSINSEQYRVISTGSVGLVTAQGSTVTAVGNFAVRELGALPVPVAVTDVNVFEDSRIYRAEISFNQPIDASTLGPALSIAELRNSGAQLVGLAQGTDYTVRYNALTNIATITFSRTVTDRSLPQQSGVPGPGLFRFVLSGAIFRGASQGVMLDGNGDGSTGDDYSFDAVVGDAGDKITAGSNTLPDGSVIDFYPAIDLNLLLDSNFASDNNPDVNRPVTLRGTIGDHPDANSNTFRSGGDVDLYRISLRAGQILVLGQMGGNARNALRNMFSASGVPVTNGGAVSVLPSATPTDLQATAEIQLLVNLTGTYYIGVAASFQGVDVADPTNIPSNNPVGGAIGAYSFDITVFDDGNTGFAGDTDSGDGALVINAPLPITFAGPDGQFNTTDDIGTFTTGRYNFTLSKGADGIANTRDDIVSGTDGGEITSTRLAGSDGTWGTSDDEIRSVVSSAIGLPGAVGVPSQISPDADVYRLNGGQPILPGTRVRFTLRLTDSAGNIGLTPVEDALGGISGLSTDLLGDVQIALFEMPSGTGFTGAKLLASPSEFLPIGGQAPRTTTDGTNSYGYDANGDFFMEVVLPGGQDVTSVNTPASYAIYVQGAVRSDYTLDILTQGTGNVTRSSQNVLLELSGGSINWLEAAGVDTKIDRFDASVLGFAGQINGVDVDDYIVDSLLSNLNSIFAAADVDITVSDDASSFEGADFSTVFIAGNTEPNAFFNDGTFGASQHVDMLNVDKNDQAVVFLPSLAQLGNDPSQAGVDNLVRALTAAVGRRIGELIGLRITANDGPGAAVAIMSTDSVTNNPGAGGSYVFNNAPNRLSGLNDATVDTNFFLGVQNSFQLIQRILKRQS